MRKFNPDELKGLYKAPFSSSKNDNGQVTIIGGSRLFHGAPLLSLTTASRIVDMVYFSSTDPSTGEVAEKIKSKLFSFIWVPWEEVKYYVQKSDAVLIGPGMMRYGNEQDSVLPKPKPGDPSWQETREVTRELLLSFAERKWVIDAGSLQVMDVNWIPEGSILTPNKKEFKILFGNMAPEEASKKHKCTIVVKGPSTFVYAVDEVIEVTGGNPGLTKGGTGDVLAGLCVSLLAKNSAVLAASASSFLIKAAADSLFSRVGTAYNSDDLAREIPVTMHKYSLFLPQKMR